MRTPTRLLAIATLACTCGCATETRHLNPMSPSDVTRYTSVRDSESGTKRVLGPIYQENRRLGDQIYHSWARLLAVQSSPNSRQFEFRMACGVMGLSSFGECTAHDSSGASLPIEDITTSRTVWVWPEFPTRFNTSAVIILPTGYLQARVEKGLDVLIEGPRGELRLTFPDYYVRAFLEKVRGLSQ